MKKFVIFIGIVCILVGARFADNGLLNIRFGGNYTEFFDGGYERVYSQDNRPILNKFDGYTRLDIVGGVNEAKLGLDDLNAKTLWQEEFDNIIVIYAYTKDINKYEYVHGKKVNVMVAVNNNAVSFGCPLLKGSY